MKDKIRILIIDDEVNSTQIIRKTLFKKGYSVTEENNSSKAAELINKEHFDIIISDLQMPVINGMDLLKMKPRDAIFIMITGYGSIASAVESMKQGAFDYINKPFSMEEFCIKVDKAAEKIEMSKKINELKAVIEGEYSFGNIIGKSKKMLEVFELIKRVSQINVNVLIEGESGTGKELVAKAIHNNSGRKNKPFIAINCSAIPENLLESELFGHVKGAFTGATEFQKGVFEQAHGGTLFLDEIAEMPYNLQAKLLRILERWEVKPLGSDKIKKVDVRLISATNQDIKKFIEEKKFRIDLFYRISTVSILLPPLNERRDDIPLLVNNYLKKLSFKLGKKFNITSDTLKLLMNHRWAGNVRELENLLEQAAISANKNIITINEFKSFVKEDEIMNSMDNPEATSLDEMEKKYIAKVLIDTEFNKQKASKILGIDRKTLYKKIKEYNIKTK
jgi:DNA-binding NtrC family response regulator